MRGLRDDSPASVAAEDADRLVVAAGQGPERRIAISGLDWIAFVTVGDSFLADEDGWWVFGQDGGALAVWHGCPVIDTLMRGPLARAADAVGELSILYLAAAPAALRAARRRGGVAALDAAELAALRADATRERVASVHAFPMLP